MQSPLACLVLRYLYLCSIVVPKAERIFVQPSRDGDVLSVCIHVLGRPVLGVARVDARVVAVQPRVGARVRLVHGASVLQSSVVVRLTLWKWEGARMITASCVLLSIAETVSLMVFALSKQTTRLGLGVLDCATDYNLTLPPWLTPTVTLALYSLSTQTTRYLLRHYNMLLMDDRWLHAYVLKLSVLGPWTFSRKELLLISVPSLFNLSSLRSRTLRLCKVLCSLERFRSMGRLYLDFIRMGLLMSNLVLLLHKHRLLLLCYQELLLVVCAMLTLT